ncbi:MAG: hypothetical protein ACR2G6_11210 [Gemmatimonadaceae bacterium]
MTARTFQDRKGRHILEDSTGELWMMYESAKATGSLEPPAKPGSLVFANHAEDRVFFRALKRGCTCELRSSRSA